MRPINQRKNGIKFSFNVRSLVDGSIQTKRRTPFHSTISSAWHGEEKQNRAQRVNGERVLAFRLSWTRSEHQNRTLSMNAMRFHVWTLPKKPREPKTKITHTHTQEETEANTQREREWMAFCSRRTHQQMNTAMHTCSVAVCIQRQ